MGIGERGEDREHAIQSREFEHRGHRRTRLHQREPQSTRPRLLEALGHRVESSWPAALSDPERPLRTIALGPLGYRLCVAELAELLGRPVGPSDVEPYVWTLAGLDQPPLPAERYLEAAEWEQGWVTRVAGWWTQERFDLLLTPTVCEPPPPLAEFSALADRPWDLLARMAPHLAFTEPFNATGHPAISLPLAETPDGLPVGVQLVAQYVDDGPRLAEGRREPLVLPLELQRHDRRIVDNHAPVARLELPAGLHHALRSAARRSASHCR